MQRFPIGIIFLIQGIVATAQPLPSETDRLIATGKLWITAKYFSPAIFEQSPKWDQALIAALPNIRAAQTPAEYEAAIRSLLGSMKINPAHAGSNQRSLFHYGFPPEVPNNSPSPFYSAFLIKTASGPADAVTIPMGSFSVDIPLSTDAASPNPPLAPTEAAFSASYPSAELRILAAYKIWGILHYFFAYRDLIDEDWDELFHQFLPRMISAKDALEYNLTVAEWLTHAADSYTAAQSATLREYLGEAPLGLRLRVIDKHVTVTEVLDPAARAAGIKVGDIVKKIAGELLIDRFKRRETYISASTPQRLTADVVDTLLNGADNSSDLLTLEDNLGNRKEVTLTRSLRFVESLRTLPPGESFKLLSGGIGYIDLRRLRPSEVAPAFDKLQHQSAIIIDMRGVPADSESPRLVAARLATQSDIAAAIVTGPIVKDPDTPQNGIAGRSSSYFFYETIPATPLPKYPGHTVMLQDERTIGEGEGAGLLFEAANKTEFIGSLSAGAFSVITNFSLPGGITVSFSGQDIRHGNSGKLQRVGLQPNINIAPTLNGVRTGKDEVLIKAMEYLTPKPPNPKVLPERAAYPNRNTPFPP